MYFLNLQNSNQIMPRRFFFSFSLFFYIVSFEKIFIWENNAVRNFRQVRNWIYETFRKKFLLAGYYFLWEFLNSARRVASDCFARRQNRK